MITNGDLPNFMNGVSQQAVALRLPTQLQLQENLYSTIVDGLKKRPPAEHTAFIMPSLPAGAFVQIVNRDQTEQYVVIISPGSIRVFDFAGVEKTVTTPNGLGYLSGLTAPAEQVRTLTVADYTFIVNRTKTVAATTAVFPVRPAEALINVNAGNYDKRYRIAINGTTRAEYGTPSSANNKFIVANNGLPASNPSANIWKGGETVESTPISGDPLNGDVGLRPNQAIATTEIAKRLRANLIASIGDTGAPWSVGIHMNALHVINYSVNFSIDGEDGVNGNAMKVIKDTVSRFSDLPSYGPLGFTVEVTASNGTNLDNYWVEAVKGDNPDSSAVRWRECPKPGTKRGLDAATMPHILVRNADGTFTFKRAEWDERTCGDGDKINPDPSFVGSQIEDVFFFKNRLGFLSDESCIMSKAGSYFDFFRTTATALLDDDPIDVAATHIKVSLLKHAVPFQDTLLLFTPETQFRLAGNDLLTAKTASIRPLTEYSCSARVRPSVVGKTVFFTSDTDGFPEGRAAAYEMMYDKKMETVAAAEITAHCPSYIPVPTRRLAGSVDESCLAVLTDGDPGAMYVYRYYWNGDEKVQSSWSRWTFPGATLLDAAWINSDLFIVSTRTGGVFLERLRMDTMAADDAVGFMVGLDRRVTLTSFTHSEGYSTCTVPYPPAAGLRAVVVAGPTIPKGSEVRVTGISDTTVTLRGNLTGHTVMLGYAFESRARLSTIYPREPSQGGTLLTKQEGRLQLQHLSLVYDRAGFFRVEVRTDGRDMVPYVFNSFVVGSPVNGIVGQQNLGRGRMNVPIMSRNTRVEIDIVNDHWLPSSFVSATWRGIWNRKSREN